VLLSTQVVMWRVVVLQEMQCLQRDTLQVLSPPVGFKADVRWQLCLKAVEVVGGVCCWPCCCCVGLIDGGSGPDGLGTLPSSCGLACWSSLLERIRSLV